MTELEKIQIKIGEGEKRLAEVMQKLRNLKKQIETTRKEQGVAIVKDKNAEKLGEEVVSLQAEFDGVNEARLQLLETLRDLQALKSNELRAIARDQAEKEKSEILLIEQDIYASLVQAANRLPDLRMKRADYVAQLQAAGSQNARDEGHKITMLFETLRREIPDLLDRFPRSVIADGTLPTSSSIRGMIKG